MKKLIRRKVSHDFATAEGGWTEDIAKAQQFPDLLVITSSLRAQYAPHEIELYYAFGEHEASEFDFAQNCNWPETHRVAA